MKIKTYVAKDMRQALRLIREEQGADAVILSTRSVPDGVEVAAAVDYEAAVHVPRLSPAAARTAEKTEFAALLARAGVSPAAAPAPVPVAMPEPISESPAQVVPVPAQEPPRAVPAARIAEPRPAAAALTAPETQAGPNNVPAMVNAAEVTAELKGLRALLEQQIAQLAWNDLTRRAPVQAEILKQLTEIGLSSDLALDLVREIPAGLAIEDAQRRALAFLARRLSVHERDWMETGGRIAFVGPTGVGKTTVLAKLAARWALHHGARDLAIVSLDAERIGAQEQIRVLGRLLGAQVYTAEDESGLRAILQSLQNTRMVLIDTAGVSPRDPEFDSRFEFLRRTGAAPLEICLVVSAAAQAGMLGECVERFASLHPHHAIVTKLDEAASLGGTLTALVRAKLAVAYVTDGQRIPDDLNTARVHQLIARAVQLTESQKVTAGEDLLIRCFGGVANDIA